MVQYSPMDVIREKYPREHQDDYLNTFVQAALDELLDSDSITTTHADLTKADLSEVVEDAHAFISSHRSQMDRVGLTPTRAGIEWALAREYGAGFELSDAQASSALKEAAQGSGSFDFLQYTG